MIIRKLELHNFGVYAGTNILKFTGKKPVVLIGGMNGRGKTTILEAVLLGLYGSNSIAYKESRYKSYGQYLKSYVNRLDGTCESYVELEFSVDNTDEEVYTVKRNWDSKKQRVSERILVKKCGETNDFLTKNWGMFIESLLPSALSSFFFFDGEKIAELAVEETSQQMKESIRAMLGISVLDVLNSDLDKIIRSISKRKSENHDLQELDSLRSQKDAEISKLNEIDSSIEMLEKKISDLEIKREELYNEYSVKGGDIVAQKQELLTSKNRYLLMKEKNKEQLLETAASELPLLMVQELLNDIYNQGKEEQEKKNSLMAFEQTQLFYREYKEENDASNDIKAFMEYMNNKMEKESGELIYDLSESTLLKLEKLQSHGLLQFKLRTQKIQKETKMINDKIEEIDNYLAVDIDESSLNQKYKKIKKTEKEIIDCEVEMEILKAERITQHGISMTAQTVFSRKAETVLANMETIDSDERTVKYAHIAIDIIREYKYRLQKRKTALLAETMTNCYKKLANKKNLVDKIEMDSETLDLIYLNKQNEEVAKKRLSAGEKQLMVISLLWALAICSKKKLPVIIDTPLSRLDSSHRRALIKTYFPNASDQTIILSTDSEIDERYYEIMKPSIGDEFTLEYNDEEKKTSIRTGYFDWRRR